MVYDMHHVAQETHEVDRQAHNRAFQRSAVCAIYLLPAPAMHAACERTSPCRHREVTFVIECSLHYCSYHHPLLLRRAHVGIQTVACLASQGGQQPQCQEAMEGMMMQFLRTNIPETTQGC